MLLLVFCAGAKAETGGQDVIQWNDKLGRGLLNAVTSPIEIPREINFTSNDINLAAGWTYGLARGIGYTFLRFGTGMLDAVTAPWNWPDAHKASLVEPEYPWEKDRTKLVSQK